MELIKKKFAICTEKVETFEQEKKKFEKIFGKSAYEFIWINFAELKVVGMNFYIIVFTELDDL